MYIYIYIYIQRNKTYIFFNLELCVCLTLHTPQADRHVPDDADWKKGVAARFRQEVIKSFAVSGFPSIATDCCVKAIQHLVDASQKEPILPFPTWVSPELKTELQDVFSKYPKRCHLYNHCDFLTLMCVCF